MYVCMRDRDFLKIIPNAPHEIAILMTKQHNFTNASHGSAIFFKIFRMLRTGARFSSKFSGCSARERDFP